MPQNRASSEREQKKTANLKSAADSTSLTGVAPAGREQETKMHTSVTGAGETSVETERAREFHDPDDGGFEAAADPNRINK